MGTVRTEPRSFPKGLPKGEAWYGREVQKNRRNDQPARARPPLCWRPPRVPAAIKRLRVGQGRAYLENLGRMREYLASLNGDAVVGTVPGAER